MANAVFLMCWCCPVQVLLVLIALVSVPCMLLPKPLITGNSVMCWCCPVQVLLVLIALVSVPFMLLPKPMILKKRHETRAAQLEAFHLHILQCNAGAAPCRCCWC